MDYHNDVIDKCLQKDEQLKYSCSASGYSDNLTRITITYLGFVLVIAGVIAWFYPEKTFSYALGAGLFGMVLVFVWAYFMIKKQSANKAFYEDIVYAITDSRILTIQKSTGKILAQFYFATITHAFVESCKNNCGTVYFQPNANMPYVSSKLSNIFLYTVQSVDSSRLLHISNPEKVCDIINQCVDDYEKKHTERKKG
ncbi:MAG: hypothetical protein IJO29_02715 [Oscillospiraceae bacterium]|nr:hypothetical protein [Oscillospiraceae bacterium]